METLKIELEVTVKDETLQKFAETLSNACINSLAKIADQYNKDKEPEHKTIVEPEPTHVPNVSPNKAKPGEDDWLYKDVTDDELMAATRAAVKFLKEHGTQQAGTYIREKIFSRYNIANSKDCPKEMRPRLLKELEEIPTAF